MYVTRYTEFALSIFTPIVFERVVQRVRHHRKTNTNRLNYYYYLGND